MQRAHAGVGGDDALGRVVAADDLDQFGNHLLRGAVLIPLKPAPQVLDLLLPVASRRHSQLLKGSSVSPRATGAPARADRSMAVSTRKISYAVFCLKQKDQDGT